LESEIMTAAPADMSTKLLQSDGGIVRLDAFVEQPDHSRLVLALRGLGGSGLGIIRTDEAVKEVR
jgi:hypothetical protein